MFQTKFFHHIKGLIWLDNLGCMDYYYEFLRVFGLPQKKETRAGLEQQRMTTLISGWNIPLF